MGKVKVVVGVAAAAATRRVLAFFYRGSIRSDGACRGYSGGDSRVLRAGAGGGYGGQENMGAVDFYADSWGGLGAAFI